MDTAAFHGVAQLGVENDALILEIAQGIGISGGHIRAAASVPQRLQSQGVIALPDGFGEGQTGLVAQLHLANFINRFQMFQHLFTPFSQT